MAECRQEDVWVDDDTRERHGVVVGAPPSLAGRKRTPSTENRPNKCDQRHTPTKPSWVDVRWPRLLNGCGAMERSFVCLPKRPAGRLPLSDYELGECVNVT